MSVFASAVHGHILPLEVALPNFLSDVSGFQAGRYSAYV